MKIHIESNHFDEKCRCDLCGAIFVPQEVVARAYRDSGDYLSDVCPTCLAMGSEGISQRLRDRARYLKLMAWELERLADRPIDLPTIEQLNIANQIENALR